MASDYMTWVYNPTYNSAKRRDEQLAEERRAVDRKVSDANQRLNNIERDIANQASIDRKELDWKLARERERLLEGLDDLDENIRIEIGRQNIQFREQLDSVRLDMGRLNVRVGQVDRRITNLADRFANNLSNIFSQIENQKERARAYANQVQFILSQISELHPDKLTPDQYTELNQLYASVQLDIKNGDSEAAIGVAQTSLPIAAELRTRLEVLNDEYSQLVVQIHECCSEIFERIQRLRIPEKNRVTIEIAPLFPEFDGRISFWTNGVFDEVIHRFEQIRVDVKEKYEVDMDIEALRRALEDILVINQNLDECVSFSHTEYTESAFAQFLAERIHDYLTFDNSWHLINSGFVDDDERRSYAFSYNNGAGLTASFVTLPSRIVIRRNRNGSIEYGDSQFRVEVFNSDPTEDQQLCVLTRNGILERLSEVIDIGDNAEKQPAVSSNLDTFLTGAISAGDKIKDGRLETIKDRIGF